VRNGKLIGGKDSGAVRRGISPKLSGLQHRH
jgi:hypothetical protein